MPDIPLRTQLSSRYTDFYRGDSIVWRECYKLIYGSLEVLFPRECLICTRPLRGASICFRCHPRCHVDASHRCGSCFGPIANDSHDSVCSTCKTFPPNFQQLRYLWEYGDLARDYVRAMKYQPSVYLTRYAAHLLADRLAQLFNQPHWDVIVPVPSSPQMLKKRAFHPCVEMAWIINKRLSNCRIANALRHHRARSPQASRTHAERLQGFKHIFQIRRPHLIRNQRILLIEDVITTGATIAAASQILMEAGATSVDVLALAQARVWTRFRRLIHSRLK